MEATQQISLYSNLFYFSLTIAILGFLMAVFFFFFFDIPTVFALMTGKARKKTVQKIQKGALSREEAKVIDFISDDLKTSGNLKPKDATAEELTTTMLHKGTDEKLASVLEKSPEALVTSLLEKSKNENWVAIVNEAQTVSETPVGVTAPLKKIDQRSSSNFRFEIIESIISVNTDEII